MLLWVFTLAAHLHMPALGTIPFWVVLLLSMALSAPSYYSRSND